MARSCEQLPRIEHREDRTPTHAYEATREAAMTAFAKSWRREYANVSFWGNPDMREQPAPMASDANDPDRVLADGIHGTGVRTYVAGIARITAL